MKRRDSENERDVRDSRNPNDIKRFKEKLESLIFSHYHIIKFSHHIWIF